LGPEDRRDTVDRMPRRLVQVAIALWALAEALFLVLIGTVAWPLVLGWAVAAVVVGLVAGVLPTGAVRIVAALALLPACVVLTWEGGLFLLPAAACLAAAAILERSPAGPRTIPGHG
jgi:hypothetical protein